jgi:hypothetical protein
VIVKLLSPYQRSDATRGRIQTVEDFKHLAKKVTLLSDKCDKKVTILCDKKVTILCDKKVTILCDKKVMLLCDKCGKKVMFYMTSSTWPILITLVMAKHRGYCYNFCESCWKYWRFLKFCL